MGVALQWVGRQPTVFEAAVNGPGRTDPLDVPQLVGQPDFFVGLGVGHHDLDFVGAGEAGDEVRLGAGSLLIVVHGEAYSEPRLSS